MPKTIEYCAINWSIRYILKYVNYIYSFVIEFHYVAHTDLVLMTPPASVSKYWDGTDATTPNLANTPLKSKASLCSNIRVNDVQSPC